MINLVWIIVVLLSSCASLQAANKSMASNENVELGFSYLEKNNVTLAKTHFLLALKDQPNSVFALDAMAYFYEVVGEPGLAEHFYQQALHSSEHIAEAHNNYGTYFCRHGAFKKGIEQFMLAANDIHYVHTGSAYANAARCAKQTADDVQASQYRDKALLYGVHDERL